MASNGVLTSRPMVSAVALTRGAVSTKEDLRLLVAEPNICSSSGPNSESKGEKMEETRRAAGAEPDLAGMTAETPTLSASDDDDDEETRSLAAVREE